jgi:hypothetical protein
MGCVGSLGGNSTISSGVSGDGGMTGGGLPGGTSVAQVWFVMVFISFAKWLPHGGAERH